MVTEKHNRYTCVFRHKRFESKQRAFWLVAMRYYRKLQSGMGRSISDVDSMSTWAASFIPAITHCQCDPHMLHECALTNAEYRTEISFLRDHHQ